MALFIIIELLMLSVNESNPASEKRSLSDDLCWILRLLAAPDENLPRSEGEDKLSKDILVDFVPILLLENI